VSGGPYTTIATGVSSTSYVDRTVVNGIRYYYVVSALADTRESANSNVTTAKPLAPPAAPTSLTAKEAKAKVQLTWKQSTSPEILRNRIYRSTNGGAYLLTAEIPAGLSWTDNRAVSKTNYSYVVTAVNTIGLESPYSNAVAARPK
jgi:cellulose 1,4-beta-cellobiosidase